MNIYSWNINGIRSAAKAGFLDWLSYENPDILCLQETRCQTEDLESILLEPFNYRSYWLSAQKKGYSGVSIYSRMQPDRILDSASQLPSSWKEMEALLSPAF